jgi:hypothetical protein
MFGLDDIAGFDFSEWLMTSVFSIHNPFAVYFWLVVAVVILRFTFIIIPLVKLLNLFKGKTNSIYTAFIDLRKINSSAFKPLEQYLMFETFRMIIPGFFAILLRLIIGESSNYEWSFFQLGIVLPSIVLWALYNIIGIKGSNETIDTATKRLAPTISVPFSRDGKEKTFNTAPLVSKMFSKIVGFRKQTERLKNIESGEKSTSYKMNIEKMRVSSNHDSNDGIEIESRSIDKEAIIHNSKELAKKAQNLAGNLLVDGKRAAIVAASKTAKSFDENLSNQMESIFKIESKMKLMFVLDLLNSLGPLILIYAILPLTI